MRRANGIGKDALARMESVGAFGRQRLIRLATRTWFRFGSFHFHQRKISDRTGPGELRVVECGKVGCGSGETRRRHHDKYEVPQGGGDDGAARNAAFNPALFEETAGQEVLRDAGPGQNGGNAAANALVERAPSYVQIRTYASFEANGNSRLCGLSQEIQRPADLAQEISLSTIASCAQSSFCAATRPKPLQAGPARPLQRKRHQHFKPSMREHLMIDETRLAGVYSAELFLPPGSPPASPWRR